MPCAPEELRHVPLFSLLDDDELDVLADQVELRAFAARQRIYKTGDPSDGAYVVLTGGVHVTIEDADGQEVLFDEPRHGDVFGFASMLEGIAHQTTAIAIEPTTCLEVDRNDICDAARAQAAMPAWTCSPSSRARSTPRSNSSATAPQRNPNELIEDEMTFGQRIADHVASFGGSWTFIITFLGVTRHLRRRPTNVLGKRAWDPYPYILLNLFLSMLAAIQAPVIMMSQNRQDTRTACAASSTSTSTAAPKAKSRASAANSTS